MQCFRAVLFMKADRGASRQTTHIEMGKRREPLAGEGRGRTWATISICRLSSGIKLLKIDWHAVVPYYVHPWLASIKFPEYRVPTSQTQEINLQTADGVGLFVVIFYLNLQLYKPPNHRPVPVLNYRQNDRRFSVRFGSCCARRRTV